MVSPNIAIILYTVREPASEDLVGTLKRLRDIGWEYVQWSGMPPMSGEEALAALDEAGLRAIAGHINAMDFEADYDKALGFWKALDCADIAPGGMMSDCQDALEHWLDGARRLNALGARLREDGVRLSYHNHAYEFETFDGDDRRKLDILYDETEPENLCAELDMAWVNAGGADPAAYLRKYAGRCPVIHAKDMMAEMRDGNPHFVPLGQGVLDWSGILDAARQAGVEWIVYEQDTCDIDVFECCRVSYEFLKSKVG